MATPAGFTRNSHVAMSCQVFTKRTDFDFYRIADTVKLNTLLIADNDLIAFVADENGFIYRATRTNSATDRFDNWTVVQKASQGILGSYKSSGGFDMFGENGIHLYLSNANGATGTFTTNASIATNEIEDIYFGTQDSQGSYIASHRNIYKFVSPRFRRQSVGVISSGFTTYIADFKSPSQTGSNRLFCVGYESNNGTGAIRPLFGYYNSALTTFTKKTLPSELNNTTITSIDFGSGAREVVLATADGRIVEIPDYDDSSTTEVHSFNLNLNITQIIQETISSVKTYFFTTSDGVYRHLPDSDELRLLSRIETPRAIQYKDNHVQFCTRNGFFIEGMPDQETYWTYTTNPKDFTDGGITYRSGRALIGFPKITDALKSSSNVVQFTFNGNDTATVGELLTSDDIEGQRIIFRIHEMDAGFSTSVRSVGFFSGLITSIGIVQESPLKRDPKREIIVSCETIEEVLKRSSGGRFASRDGMRRYFPFDSSFDEVARERDNR